ncbi:MAG: hypothetical protein GY842_09065 [bacterium]|nr:hypothetical protein [bacterium]
MSLPRMVFLILRTPLRDGAELAAENLAQIDRALAGAGVPKKLWQDSIPQAPQRLATAFICRLLGEDPSLSLSSVHVSAGRGARKNAGDTPTWRIDLAVSYLTYAPAEDGIGDRAAHRS